MTIPYVTGTVSVTAGSAVVTGSGTAWATALVAGGLFGLDSNNGNPVPILSVDSNTQLTLAKPWRGTTAAGQGYWIIRDTAYLQQQTVNAQALSTYIQRLDNAALAAFASLTPAADKLGYFTGPNTGGLTDFKAKGRDIISAADMSALLGKLGPVFGGAALVPSAAEVGLSDGDFNTITVGGVYTIAGVWANGPEGNTAYTGILEVTARTFKNGYFQTLRLSGRVFYRYTMTPDAATWPNPWVRINEPVLGTVSQSGGVPTGSVIERGSNANGEYVKFADGTMICTSAIIGGISINVAHGSIYRSEIVTADFPAAFVVAPYGFGNVNNTVNAWSGCRVVSTSQWASYLFAGISRAAGDSVKFGAIGRWF